MVSSFRQKPCIEMKQIIARTQFPQVEGVLWLNTNHELARFAYFRITMCSPCAQHALYTCHSPWLDVLLIFIFSIKELYTALTFIFGDNIESDTHSDSSDTSHIRLIAVHSTSNDGDATWWRIGACEVKKIAEKDLQLLEAYLEAYTVDVNTCLTQPNTCAAKNHYEWLAKAT